MRRPPLPATVRALGWVSLLTDAASEMIYPLLPLFLSTTLGASAAMVGAIEGAAESTASLLKLASGWLSDHLGRRRPLVLAGYGLASLVRPLVAFAAAPWQVLVIRLTDRVGKGVRGAPRDALIADAVLPSERGRAFGFHRAMDHAGAAIGPIVAYLLLSVAGVTLRTVFLLAAIPGAVSVIVAVIGVRETASPPAPRASGALSAAPPRPLVPLLAVLLLFALGNATDAFLLLRATQLGVAPALLPLLWMALHLVKSASSTPAGALSDRVGRERLIIAGWLVYALVYAGFALASASWQLWLLFLVYGAFFGLTEGSEKALVSDLVRADARGRAFGWYQLVIGAAALPAALLFGAVWDARGAPSAFAMGAVIALAAACCLSPATRWARAQQQRAPGLE
ncbi:MAG: MFS transporter [Gemmatimonadaceae bacterium]|nr:MFS transporter [Gemmatimonadaceae bacterium]